MMENRPRAIRNKEDELKRLEAVSKKRPRPWVGDKMLLMEANNTTHERVKNHFEERARQAANRAKKAGGQVLQDWENKRQLNNTSNKYATKMWAEHRANKVEYLRKLRNGLISLETGKAIDESNWSSSALNPANGHIQNMSNEDSAHEDVKEGADRDVEEGADNDVDGGAEESADLMGHEMGNGHDPRKKNG